MGEKRKWWQISRDEAATLASTSTGGLAIGGVISSTLTGAVLGSIGLPVIGTVVGAATGVYVVYINRKLSEQEPSGIEPEVVEDPIVEQAQVGDEITDK